MSTQRGNVKKSGPPKHQNHRKFKNTLHDTSDKTKKIVALEVCGVCARCKEILDWKIKYKKYKPLTQPKKCVKCLQKTVKRAYYIMCQPCSSSLHLCAKCGESTDVVLKYGLEPSEEAHQQSELNFELRNLSERKRRAFLRMQEKGEFGNDLGKEESEGEYESEEEDDEHEGELGDTTGDHEQNIAPTDATGGPADSDELAAAKSAIVDNVSQTIESDLVVARGEEEKNNLQRKSVDET